MNQHDQQSQVTEHEDVLSSNDNTPTQSDPVESSSDPVGQIIDGHYEVLELVGRGGMGSVYRGKHLELNKLVAIKILDGSVISDQLAQRFDREAKAASSLRHQGIAPVTNYGLLPSGVPYLVMDFIPGQTLQQLILENGRLTAPAAIGIFIQIAEAMNYAHEMGVLHRDIKPSNVILERNSTDSKATVIDFGIARVIGPDVAQSQNVTTTGQIIGSPLYMSPEQGMGYKVDLRSDIYSLGCVMYECLTGQAPFGGANAVQTIFMHVNERPKSFSELNAQLSELRSLESIALKCLEKKPDDRYQSMQELLKDLNNARQGQALTIASRRNLQGKAAKLFLFAVLCAAGIVIAMAAIRPFFIPEWLNLQNQAFTEWRMGPDHYEAAAQFFARARARLAIDHVPPGNAIDLLFQMGRFYHTWGKNRESVEAFVSALKLADEDPSKRKLQADIRKELLQTLIQTGDYNLAIKEGTAALQIYRTLREVSETVAECAYTLGTAFRMQDMSGKAAESYSQAYKIAKEIHPNQASRIQAIAAQSLAYVLADQSKIDEAMRYGKEAVKMLQDTEGASANETITAATWLASFASEHGRQSEALSLKQEFGVK